MAGYRRNQCRRFVWLLLLIIALVCMIVAYLSSAWVVTQSSVSPSIEMGLLQKCTGGSCKDIAFSSIGHVMWKVVVALLGACIGLTFIVAICVVITFRYFMNHTRVLNCIKAAGGLASILMFVSMLLWPVGLNNEQDVPCSYNLPTQSYYMCDPWALGWAAYVMIVAMIFLAFSVCFSSLISSKPMRPETKKTITEHDFKQQDQRKGKKRRGSAPVHIETPYYPAPARPAGAGLAAPTGGHGGAKGKYVETKFAGGSGARLPGVAEESSARSKSAAVAPAPSPYLDPASQPPAVGSYLDVARSAPASSAPPAGYLDVGRSGPAAATAAAGSYLDLGRSGPAAPAPAGSYLDVGRSGPSPAQGSHLDVARSAPAQPYLHPASAPPPKAQPADAYMDPVPAPVVADPGTIPMAYLDVLGGLPSQPTLDSYMDAGPTGMAETALPAATFAGGYTDLLQSVMQFSSENGGAAMFELPSGGDGSEFGFGTMGSSNGTTVFNPLYTEGDEANFGFNPNGF